MCAGIGSTTVGGLGDPVGMMSTPLFDLPPTVESDQSTAAGTPRLLRPERHQVVFRISDLDSLLAEDHPARVVWAFVEGLDLSSLTAPIKAVAGRAGHPAIDPRILLALWLYALSEGVGSARAVARFTEAHDAYRWLCGGVAVNYHTVSDFRVAHGAALDDLLTQSLGVLLHEGLVSLERVAQDGMRVRAEAGASSFRRQATLAQCLTAAEAQVQRLAAERDGLDDPRSARQRAAQERAARERQTRVVRALTQVAALQPSPPDPTKRRRRRRQPDGRLADPPADAPAPKEPRVSTTDAEVRVMKMADGGYRPAYNIQFGTDTASQIITLVDVVAEGTDAAQLPPGLAQIEQRTGRVPAEALVDGGFASLTSLEAAAARGVTVYAPVRAPKNKTQDRYAPRPTDSPAVAAWRQRMATEQAQTIYRERAATAECVNALARLRTLTRCWVRGVAKVRCVVLLVALTHNLFRAHGLRQVARAAGGG
jgi:transposase